MPWSKGRESRAGKGRDAASYPRVGNGLRLSCHPDRVSSAVARSEGFTRFALRRPISGPNYRTFLCLALPRLTGVGFVAQAVATYRGWVPGFEPAEIEMVVASGYEATAELKLSNQSKAA